MADRSGGNDAGLGDLLERHRARLRATAGGMVGPALRPRVDPSDLVQETFLRASRDFPRFEGGDDRTLLVWLLKILANHLTDQVKHHRRLSRRCDRQGSLDALLERPGSDARRALADPGPSPSAGAARRERAVLLADAVDRLPEDYREVYRLRTLHHLPFEDVAARMGRSSGAVRMLWARALERLSAELGGRA